MPLTIDEVHEPIYISLESEEINLLDDEALNAIDKWNDDEYDRFFKEWDEVTGWKPMRG
jgi:hypothetical protein